jgi:hypothetical protein
LCRSNGKKAWHTLSIIYSINPRGCPPLATISLVQAVVNRGVPTTEDNFYGSHGISAF